MWDEKTVENIAPTNSVRTPYELTVGKLNSDELRRTGPWKSWIRKFVQNLYVKIRWICIWFGVSLPKPSLNWCGFPWKQPVWALFSPYFHVGISDQTKPRQTPTNSHELNFKSSFQKRSLFSKRIAKNPCIPTNIGFFCKFSKPTKAIQLLMVEHWLFGLAIAHFVRFEKHRPKLQISTRNQWEHGSSGHD